MKKQKLEPGESGSTQSVRVKKIQASDSGTIDELVVTEEPLEIRLGYERNGNRVKRSVSVTMRTPGSDFELALGFLFTEGIITGFGDIDYIDWDRSEDKRTESVERRNNRVLVSLKPGLAFDLKRLDRNFFAASSCGICGKATLDAIKITHEPDLPRESPEFSASVLNRLSGKLRERQTVFSSTGGLHAAALFTTKGKLIAIREDVGRHNAVDKLIGNELRAGQVPVSDKLMFVSGRTSFEIMQKALAAGIPFIAAVGAPSSLAIEVANAFGMTLIGFLRNGRFNIYSGAQRVVN